MERFFYCVVRPVHFGMRSWTLQRGRARGFQLHFAGLLAIFLEHVDNDLVAFWALLLSLGVACAAFLKHLDKHALKFIRTPVTFGDRGEVALVSSPRSLAFHSEASSLAECSLGYGEQVSVRRPPCVACHSDVGPLWVVR